jgi:Uma2 family endonuclease
MSALGAALTTWDEFVALPDTDAGVHRELHDGEVIEMPPARAFHFYVQNLLTRWLTEAARGAGWAAAEFPYRPAANLQFWYADVGYMPAEDWERLRAKDYPVCAPALVIEVLSPSNQPAKLARQRIAAFSAGTREFWAVDLENRTVEVSLPGAASRSFGENDAVPVAVLPGALFPVALLFR